jgi:hypothetical protein
VTIAAYGLAGEDLEQDGARPGCEQAREVEHGELVAGQRVIEHRYEGDVDWATGAARAISAGRQGSNRVPLTLSARMPGSSSARHRWLTPGVLPTC